VRLLLRAFPARFRRQYGDELLELVAVGGSPMRDGANVVFAGLRMRLGGSVLGITLISAAALGSAALGGCVLLGSAATSGAGAMLFRRFQVALAR
jgi:hypothetical protein